LGPRFTTSSPAPLGNPSTLHTPASAADSPRSPRRSARKAAVVSPVPSPEVWASRWLTCWPFSAMLDVGFSPPGLLPVTLSRG
jgi:hypothetical protein